MLKPNNEIPPTGDVSTENGQQVEFPAFEDLVFDDDQQFPDFEDLVFDDEENNDRFINLVSGDTIDLYKAFDIDPDESEQVQADILRDNVLSQINLEGLTDEAKKEKLRKVEDELYRKYDIGIDLTGDGVYNNINAFQDVSYTLLRGLVNMSTGFAESVLLAAPDIEAVRWTKNALDKDRKAWLNYFNKTTRQTTRDVFDELAAGDFDQAALTVLETTAESLPIMAAMAIPGGKYVAVTAMAGTTYNESKDQEWFKEMSGLEKLGYVASMTAFESIGEWTGSRVITRVAKEFAKNTGDKILYKKVKDIIVGYFKGAGISFTEEFLGESVTAFGQQITDAIARGLDIDIWEFLRNIAESGFLGGMSGFAMYGAGASPSVPLQMHALAQKYSDKNVVKRREEIQGLLGDLNSKIDAQASPEAINAVIGAIRDKQTDITRDKKNKLQLLYNMDEASIREFDNMFNSIETINKELDTETNEDVKKKLIERRDELKAQMNTLVDGVVDRPKYVRDGREFTREEFLGMVERVDPEEFLSGEWNVTNDKDVEGVLEQKLKQAQEQEDAGEVPEEFTGLEEELSKGQEIVPKTDPVKMTGTPGGVLLNIGLMRGKTDERMTKEEILSKLPDDVEIIEANELMSDTEPTVSMILSRSLTDQEMDVLLKETDQEAIPQLDSDQGVMYGSLDWGAFNPDFFYLPDGRKLSEIATVVEEEVKPTSQKTQEDIEQTDVEWGELMPVEPIEGSKITESPSYANLTEDGEGNFVFYHVGKKGYKSIDPKQPRSRATSREEARSIDRVGGVSMYYTDAGTSERMVTGDAKYMVKVPMDKVYDFNSDPNGYIKEAERRFKEKHPGQAFTPNDQLAYVTQIANENGFDMVVASWDGGVRAQTTKEMAPSDVELRSGAAIDKKFENSYKPNTDKGVVAIKPKSKQSILDTIYQKISRALDRVNDYSKAYHFKEEFDRRKYSQEEITKIINENKNIPQELKNEYNEAVTAEEARPTSMITKGAKRAADVAKSIARAAKSLKLTFPNVGIVVGDNLQDVRNKIYDELVKLGVPETEARRVSDGFDDMTNGQSFFYKNKPILVAINKERANTRTAAHEMWELILNEAFGNNYPKMKTLVKGIDKRLRESGYKDVADKLKLFSEQYKGNIVFSEYLAELGGYLTEAGIDPTAFTPKQKKLLTQIKDLINKIAKSLTGSEVFLSDATAENVLEMMTTISDKIAAGESVYDDIRPNLAQGEIIDGYVTDSPIPEDAKVKAFNVNYNYNDENLPDEHNMPDPQTIESVLEKSGGAAIFVNSDGTKVGVIQNGEHIKGGWRYIYYKENKDNKIGFAASSADRVRSMHKIMSDVVAIRDERMPQHKGKPVATFVMIQNIPTMYGEWYAGEYLMDGIDKAIEKGLLKPSQVEGFFKSFINTELAKTKKKVEAAKKSNSETEEDKQKNYQTIKNGLEYIEKLNEVSDRIKSGELKTHKGRLKLARLFSSKNFSFDFRKAINTDALRLENIRLSSNQNNKYAKSMQEALREVGHTLNNFLDTYMDEALLEIAKSNNYKDNSVGGLLVGGFFADPYMSLQDYLANNENGIDHQMFNNGFTSTGETFRLDAAYDIKKAFKGMGFPVKKAYPIYNEANGTNFTKQNVTLIDKYAIAEWLMKNGYEDLVYSSSTSVAGAIYTSIADARYQESVTAKSQKEAPKEEKPKPSKYPLRLLLGLPKDRKITIAEKTALKESIKAQARGARNAKAAWNKIAKELAAEIKELLGSGTITQKQAFSILNKYKSTNLFNPVSIEEFVDYAHKVFLNSTYDELVSNAKKKAKSAKKNIATKIGIAKDLVPLLDRIFSVDFEVIPDATVAKWEELVDMFSGTSKVLSLDEINYVTNKANEVLNEIHTELSRIDVLKDVFDNYDNVKINKDGSIDFNATLENMLEDGVINADHAEIMKRNKSKIIPPTEAVEKTEEEKQADYEDEREKLLAIVDEIEPPTTANLPTRDERGLAKKLFQLIKTKGVEKLNNNEIKNLLKVYNNIKMGYLPAYTQILVEKINANNNTNLLVKAIRGAKVIPIERVYARLKSLFTGNVSELEAVKRNPLTAIDQVFGDFKTKTIFNTYIRPLAEAENRFTSEYGTIDAKLSKAEVAIEKSFKGRINDIVKSKFKIMTYMIQLEYESNEGNPEVNPAIGYIDKTIEAINSGLTNYGKRDVAILEEIKKDFETEGNIDTDKLYNSFNEAEKNAIKTVQELNMDLADKAVYTSTIIRGEQIDQRKDYIHLNVMNGLDPTGKATDNQSLSEYNKSSMPSTRGKSLIKRSKGVKPLHFDVFAAAKRGARYTLLDYHMTEPVRTFRRTANAVMKETDNKEVAAAINKAIETAIDNMLSSNFNQSTLSDHIINYINKTGYRVMLGSVTRAISELASNLSYAMIQDPKAYATGMTLSKYAMSAEGMEIMRNVGSFQITRLYPSGTLSGKLVDNNMIDQAILMKPGRARSDVAEKMNVIYNSTLKKAAIATELTSDFLVSTPDKMISRPLWFGAFANEFKALTGEAVEFDKLASNDEAYIDQYADILKAAAIKADDTTVKAAATDSKFGGILAGTIKPDQAWYKTLFNQFNRFMTRFMMYEYVTARTGINAMIGNGSITKMKGAQLVAAVTTRMTLYTMMSKVLTHNLLSMLFGDAEDEEEKKTFLQGLMQSLASGATSLILGRNFGNVTRSAINFGVEKINKEYLDMLREGDYNMYEDAITFSALPAEKPAYGKSYGWEVVKNLTGAYSPFIKAADRAVTVINKEPKTMDAVERRRKELMTRTPLELMGTLGFVPLYPDIRRIVIKDLYKGLDDNKISKSELKKVNPKMYERLYGKQDEMMREMRKRAKGE